MNIVCYGLFIYWCIVPNVGGVVCPPVVSWSTKDQVAASVELKKLPISHPLRRMAVVTTKQRDLIRACKNGNR